MSKVNLSELFQKNERLATLTNHILVSMMLACLVVSIIQFIGHILPGWEGSYLVWVCLMISFEGMYSRRIAKQMDFLSREWFIFRITEWVVILAALKLVQYLLHGFDQLWRDIPLWQQNFFNSFFKDEYIFSIGMAILIWLVSGMFAEDLEKLEGDEKVLKLERESGISEVRPAVRRNLANRILLFGGLMVVLNAFIRLESQVVWGDRAPANIGAWNILLYFVLGLILLSLTQFSILRVHWSLQRIPILPNLASRWLIYSALFLALVALVSLLLPTRYSVGLLDILGFLFFILTGLLSLVLFFLLFPIFIVFSLLARLFGRTTSMEPPSFVPPPAPAITPGGEVPWIELLKSVLFWVMFFGVIGYSVYYYLYQNKALAGRLRRLPLLSAFWHAWRWLSERLRNVNRGVSAVVEAGIRRLRARRGSAASVATWRFLNLRRLSPRQQILFFYLAMLRRGGEKGVSRKPDQTPYEYSRSLGSHLPEAEGDVSELTEQFVEARYSLHEVTREQASLVQRYWERIRRALREAFKP